MKAILAVIGQSLFVILKMSSTPAYFSDLIEPTVPVRYLRSSDALLVTIGLYKFVI